MAKKNQQKRWRKYREPHNRGSESINIKTNEDNERPKENESCT